MQVEFHALFLRLVLALLRLDGGDRPRTDIQTLSKCIEFKLAADDYRLARLYVVLDYVTVLSRCDNLENFRGSPVREIRGENECIAISRGLFIGLENLSPERDLVALAKSFGHLEGRFIDSLAIK